MQQKCEKNKFQTLYKLLNLAHYVHCLRLYTMLLFLHCNSSQLTVTKQQM